MRRAGGQTQDTYMGSDHWDQAARIRCWNPLHDAAKIRGLLIIQSPIGRAAGVGSLILKACEGRPQERRVPALRDGSDA